MRSSRSTATTFPRSDYACAVRTSAHVTSVRPRAASNANRDSDAYRGKSAGLFAEDLRPSFDSAKKKPRESQDSRGFVFGGPGGFEPQFFLRVDLQSPALLGLPLRFARIVQRCSAVISTVFRHWRTWATFVSGLITSYSRPSWHSATWMEISEEKNERY